MTVLIEPAHDAADREACARMMSESEPWITLQRAYDRCTTIVNDPARELYVARSEQRVVGFILLTMKGQFPGYITTICVHATARSAGIGTQLVAFAEQRIHRESPNVFLCVSSFNTGAQRLYERLGFEYVGALKDFIVDGHDELLYRKTIGPWNTFTPRE